jgi:hypothetical protein
MIELIVAKFQTFRHRLFQLFPYRAGATMDLIDAVSAMTTADSVVKLSLSELFRRTYSSALSRLKFRIGLRQSPYNRRSQVDSYCINTDQLAKPAVVDSTELSR